MFDAILLILGYMDPIWVAMTIVVGLLVGLLSKDIAFEKKTLYLLAFMYLPYLIGRTIAFLVGGFIAVSSTGYVGAIFFLIYILAFILGRRI